MRMRRISSCGSRRPHVRWQSAALRLGCGLSARPGQVMATIAPTVSCGDRRGAGRWPTGIRTGPYPAAERSPVPTGARSDGVGSSRTLAWPVPSAQTARKRRAPRRWRREEQCRSSALIWISRLATQHQSATQARFLPDLTRAVCGRSGFSAQGGKASTCGAGDCQEFLIIARRPAAVRASPQAFRRCRGVGRNHASIVNQSCAGTLRL
jgi:hypothetical protein